MGSKYKSKKPFESTDVVPRIIYDLGLRLSRRSGVGTGPKGMGQSRPIRRQTLRSPVGRFETRVARVQYCLAQTAHPCQPSVLKGGGRETGQSDKR